jgi:predicted O-methyltransferase YrrM
MFEFPRAILAPGDEVCGSIFADLVDYYHYYYDQIKRFDASSVVEIGVRAGYSAYAMLSANPKMHYVGYDIDTPNSHGFGQGMFAYAQEMLRREFPQADLQFKCQDTQKLSKLDEEFHLASIDGDHSDAGCTHDLELCFKAATILLVDDYDFLTEVGSAVNRFIKAHDLRHEYVKNFRGMMIIYKYRSFVLGHPTESLYDKYKEFTMIPRDQFLENINLCMEYKDVPGCVVECGVWKGGMIAGIAEALGKDRNYFFI